MAFNIAGNKYGNRFLIGDKIFETNCNSLDWFNGSSVDWVQLSKN